MKSKWKLYGLVTAVMCLAITAWMPSMVTVTNIQRLQPFISMQAAYDSAISANGPGVGGIVKYFVAKSTDTLKICDVVYIDTLNAVSKSTTLANYNKLAGVVIGGRSTSMMGSIAAADCGSTAALPTRPVIVMRTGRYWVQVDASAGTTAGGLIIPSSSVAGKIRPATTAIDTLYRVLGRSVNGGAASTTILADINAK